MTAGAVVMADDGAIVVTARQTPGTGPARALRAAVRLFPVRFRFMTQPSSPAFARLRHDLMRRRWGRLEPRLRIELAGLAVLLAAFAFWQLRLSYANVAFTHGAGMAGAALLATLAGIAVFGGVGTALRLERRLRRAPAGPSWLALPVPPSELLRLQAWEAEMPLRALVLLALAAWIAAFGVATTPVWVIGALAFPIAWTICCRVGRGLALALAPRNVVARDSAPAGATGADARALARLAAVWAVRSPSRSGERRREGSWRRLPTLLVLAAKDLLLARRARSVRASCVLAMALVTVSVAAWSLPQPALRASAFVVALLAAAAVGDWLIALGGCDPFPVLRSLPVGPGSIWAARVSWGALVTALLVGAHATFATERAGVIRVSLVWLAIAGLAITTLAVNLQITLFPQRESAQRVFSLALGLALVCSLMIPLLGWVVLLAAVLHSARRLPRWWSLEDLA
jgi:hypothetical protein